MSVESDIAYWREQAQHAGALVTVLSGHEPRADIWTPERLRDEWKALYERRLKLLRRMGGMDAGQKENDNA